MERVGAFIEKGETVLVNAVSVVSGIIIVVLDIYSEMPDALL